MDKVETKQLTVDRRAFTKQQIAAINASNLSDDGKVMTNNITLFIHMLSEAMTFNNQGIKNPLNISLDKDNFPLGN